MSLAQQPEDEPFDLSTRPGPPSASVLADLALTSDPTPDDLPDSADRLHAPEPPPRRAGGGPGPSPTPGRGSFGSTPGNLASGPSGTPGPRRDSGYPGGTPSSGGAGPSGTGSSGGARARGPAHGQDADPLDLPLFGPAANTPSDRPMIAPSTPPRPPLSVRRPTGEIPRARPRVTPSHTPVPPPRVVVDEPRLALDEPDRLLPDADLDLDDEAAPAAPPRETAASFDASGDADAAPLGARAAAALLDLAFLALVDAIVLHFTLRLTGVDFGALDRIPVAPLAGFLALLNGGYLAMFIAASGQTMGKMAMGVKVVSMQGGAVPFGAAVLRAILWLLTIVPAGIGAIPALLTDDRRALHDRLADTRVIKVMSHES